MKIGLVCTPYTHNMDVLECIIQEHLGIPSGLVWYTEPARLEYDCLVFAGGIPFNPELPGSLARLQNALKEYALKDGLIVGLGAGFSFLLQCGILPGRLVENASGRHICRMQHVVVQSNGCPGVNLFTVKQMYEFPVSHAFGNYQPDQNPGKSGRVVFQYSDAGQNIHRRTSPDGSWNNVAGICSENGRIIGTQLRPDLGFFMEFKGESSRLFFKALGEMIR